MNADSKVIPLSLYPTGFIESFLNHGATLSELLLNTGIDRSLLGRRDAKISYAQQYRLVRNGLTLCPEPGLGLLVGLEFDWTYHGNVGHVVYCSPSLREAGEAMRRYVIIAQPYYAKHAGKPVGYIDQNGIYVEPIQCFPLPRFDAEVAQFEVEFRLATMLRFWDLCGNKSVADPSVRVRLAYPEPAHSNLYDRLPCASIRFGCGKSEVYAHRDFVLEPWRQLRKHAYERVLAQCEEELRQSKLITTYTDAVRSYLSKYYMRQVALEEVASTLHMTPRTLTRRLAAENTTFRHIQRDVKLKWTVHYLRSSNLDIEEISRVMGFSCASSLRRAVKSLSGETIGSLRARAG